MLKERDFLPVRTVSLIVTGTNWSTTNAAGTPFQKLDGSWWLDLIILGNVSVATDDFSIFIAGIDLISDVQAITGWQSTAPSIQTDFCFAQSTNIIRIALTATASQFIFNGRVQLKSKPDL